MIEKATSYKVGDKIFATLQEAQCAEIKKLFDAFGDDEPWTQAAAAIVAHREKVIDILSTTPTSKPRARKINGGKKVRKVEKDAQPAKE